MPNAFLQEPSVASDGKWGCSRLGLMQVGSPHAGPAGRGGTGPFPLPPAAGILPALVEGAVPVPSGSLPLWSRKTPFVWCLGCLG